MALLVATLLPVASTVEALLVGKRPIARRPVARRPIARLFAVALAAALAFARSLPVAGSLLVRGTSSFGRWCLLGLSPGIAERRSRLYQALCIARSNLRIEAAELAREYVHRDRSMGLRWHRCLLGSPVSAAREPQRRAR